MTTPKLAPTTLALSGLAALLLAAGCGAGVAGVIAGSGSSSGGSTPALNAFTVERPKVAPAGLVLDASQAVRVALFYDEGQGEKPMDALLDFAGNEVDLVPGVNPAIRWDFASEQGLAATFEDGVRLLARLPGGAVLSGGEIALGLGNDAPVVHSVEPMPTDPQDPDESAGIVEIRLRISDTSSDLVDVTVEWRRASDPPDAWNPATAAGVFPDGVETSPVPGVELSFFWNTNVDLADEEEAVFFRVTADDRTDESVAFETQLAFRVDNNAAPIVQLDSGPLILNSDELRGIPIPFRVIDEEGDLVEVIFQWRREGEEFPSLDTSGDGEIGNDELDVILADPVLRQEKHVCTPYPHYAEGHVVPINEDTVRLPELASSESWILASGIVGRTLELLRPSSILEPITPTWRSNPLISPIAALPIGDGLTALVLDIPGKGRLREIELATGRVVREIAQLGPGVPSAMAYERGEKAVLLALDDAGTWRIERVELKSGAITELIVSDGSEPAPVRGIASLGTKALVFTAGTSLFHLDYRDLLAPQLGTLLTQLATPWGVAVDPLAPDRIYVSERDANRVLAIELDSHWRLPVVVKTADLRPGTLDAPEALALERQGSRMLIITGAPGGRQQLLGLDLGATGGNRTFSIGGASDTGIASISNGSHQLRLSCHAASNELGVAGGIEQQRVIDGHSTATQEASVEAPFDPAPSSGQTWRVSEEAERMLRTSAHGVWRTFVWDSSDAFTGSVFVRAAARDDELGLTADGTAPKQVQAALEVEPLALSISGLSAMSVVAADLDGDGDQDLASVNFPTPFLSVFFQQSPGVFDTVPLLVGGPTTIRQARSIAAADFNGDGKQDLASANYFGDNLTVFFQLAPGSFTTTPLVLGDSATTLLPQAVIAADLDGDNDQDLVSANSGGNSLTVFLQVSPGSFAPSVLGGPATTLGPRAVVAADLDGDGDLDLASANEVGSTLAIFFQTSRGGFAAAPIVLGGPGTTVRPVALAAADFDGDGDQDLVSANWDGHDLTMFSQVERGSFAAEPVRLGGSATTKGPYSVAGADLDGDGDQDIVSANYLAGTLSVFQQTAPGIFAAVPLTLSDVAMTSGAFALAPADLDGDGDQDLVSGNRKLTVFLQRSRASFGSDPLMLGGPTTTEDPLSVAAGDLDADGDQDLVSANIGGRDLTAFFQLSPGNFAPTRLVLGGPGMTNGCESVAVADLDRDGDQDIVSANLDRQDLTVFFQLSPGSFATTPLVLDGGFGFSPTAVVASDLDGDGAQDLISANEPADNLTVFFQISPGAFALPPLVLGGTGITNRPRSVAAADLDGDGDQDLVSANTGEAFTNGEGSLTIFFQLSRGSFSATPLTLGAGTANEFYWVAAADLDCDGDEDLVSVAHDSLRVFFQRSPGDFGAAPLVLGGSTTMDPRGQVATADFDADGDIDVASSNSHDGTLKVFLQLSPGDFATAPLVVPASGTGFDPTSITTTDLDGDGDEDLVATSHSKLTVFFGGR